MRSTARAPDRLSRRQNLPGRDFGGSDHNAFSTGDFGNEGFERSPELVFGSTGRPFTG